ncbi:hypothetical protein E2C01_093779 [Portunus trituberculatus]|uniref:Transmembrane protein n=1 Tax=Portunus trituberculatus TaxID=210409 RepID=A0A5B7JUE1_PORTR|nr:hypothetical protein [Portunus trituberculatus]
MRDKNTNLSLVSVVIVVVVVVVVVNGMRVAVDEWNGCGSGLALVMVTCGGDGGGVDGED